MKQLMMVEGKGGCVTTTAFSVWGWFLYLNLQKDKWKKWPAPVWVWTLSIMCQIQAQTSWSKKDICWPMKGLVVMLGLGREPGCFSLPCSMPTIIHHIWSGLFLQEEEYLVPALHPPGFKSSGKENLSECSSQSPTVFLVLIRSHAIQNHSLCPGRNKSKLVRSE